jgi:nucleotidyltransferase/DNA polymerase involved in DNA repair
MNADLNGSARISNESLKNLCREERTLCDLVSVGPAIAADFALLGIGTVSQLAKYEPEALYRKLCRKTGTRHDSCVLDVFSAAVAQARDPKLPLEKCKWWYWSRLRKGESQS